MNPELKQRLIGAVVVTALAAIFIPMLFDDPVENSGQQVAELTLPKQPEPPKIDAAKKLPDDFGNALAPVEQEDTNTQSSTEAPTQVIEEIEPTPTEKNTEDDLVATEADNEDAAPVKNTKPNTLDTGIVAEDSHADDENSKPSHTETNKANLSPIEKSVRKLKSHEATTATKHDLPDDSAVDQTTPKTSTKPTTSKNNAELGRWSIQAGSFSKKDNAMALLEKLQKQGFPVSLQTKGTIYRLKIGPELDKKRITHMKKKLDDQHIQAFIIAE